MTSKFSRKLDHLNDLKQQTMDIKWDDERFVLGVEEMDNTHIEFVDLINCMSNASDAEFVYLFDQLLQHTRAHFDAESRLMMQHGFPATAEHQGEHQRVLGEMTRFCRSVRKGLVALGRCYVSESLTQWFPLHAATMDSALAAHLKARAAISTGTTMYWSDKPRYR